MSKYRIIAVERQLFNFIELQEKRWWGWKTISSEITACQGAQEAYRQVREIQEILESSNKPITRAG